jgi:hypothetical protein
MKYVLVRRKRDNEPQIVHNECEFSIDEKGVIDVTKGDTWVASYNPDFFVAEELED